MRKHAAAFTLVELLVALFVLALMAALSWRGIDGMVRAKEATESRADEVLTLQVALAQWSADLEAMEKLPGIKAIDWNGRVLRITRRSTASLTDGVVVVGWTRRIENDKGMWLRWQSPAVTTQGELEQAWARANQWSQNAGTEDIAREVAITPLDDWQIFYFRENAWSNPQSSEETSSTIATRQQQPPGVQPTPGANAAEIPDGIRIVLTLPQGQAVSGIVTRDWVRPQVGGKVAQ